MTVVYMSWKDKEGIYIYEKRWAGRAGLYEWGRTARVSLYMSWKGEEGDDLFGGGIGID